VKKGVEIIDVNNLLNDNILNDNIIDPIQYQYYKNLKDRRIIINNEINDDIIEMAVLPLREMDSDGSGKPIEIILNTIGGSVYDGFQLISIIENLKTPTTIIVAGKAISMGALIAMAGKNNPNVKTICSPYSVFLIHSGSDCMAGTVNMIKDTFHFSEKYEKIIEDYVVSHSKISTDLYLKKSRYEWWFTAPEALELGVVDEII